MLWYGSVLKIWIGLLYFLFGLYRNSKRLKLGIFFTSSIRQMSRHSSLSHTLPHSHSHDRTSVVLENAETLAVIREEQITPTASNLEVGKKPAESSADGVDYFDPSDCPCLDDLIERREATKMLTDREEELKAEFATLLEKELNAVKERFDFILQNEQVRASYMLREAHRERQEKIGALQRQLECKNMAGLMYVMCSERRKCKLEKLKIIEEYTSYIRALQDILSEGQALILHLSRGYKTAARVDQEWREKTKSIITEFQAYVYHYAGGSPDTNQYVFDIPALLKTQAPIQDDPLEDPCPCPQEEEEESVNEEPKEWWENMAGDKRPFVMMGDMATFRPDERAKIMKTARAAKSAPPKWKEYVFNTMFLRSDCPNVDATKDEYLNRLPEDKWVCHGMKEELPSPEDVHIGSRESSRRHTSLSYEMRTAMGSILRMITASNAANVTSPAKAIHLLGARDSMEIASSTKLRGKFRDSLANRGSKSVSVSVGFVNKEEDFDQDEVDSVCKEGLCLKEGEAGFVPGSQLPALKDEDDDEAQTGLGSLQQDSIQAIKNHVPDKDHKINSEKFCPMEDCQRQHVSEFMSTLPAYWRESPFAQFQQTFESYETCSPEQLEILRNRIETARGASHQSLQSPADHDHLLEEWTPSVEGVAVQTSEISLDLPPCTCRMPHPSPGTSVSKLYNVRDLIPVKEALNEINKECFFDNNIQFDRFKVIGQDYSNSNSNIVEFDRRGSDFKQIRATEITKILNRHPSLLDMFQGNTV